MRKKVTAVFIHRPKTSLAVTAGVCLILWGFGLQFGLRGGIDSALDARGGHREVYDRAAELGDIERTLLVDVEVPRVFSAEALSLVNDLSNAFRDLESVASVKSLTHSVMPVRKNFSLGFQPLIPPPPWDEEQLAALQSFCLEHPLIRDVMVAANGRRTLIAVAYREDVFAARTPEEVRAEASVVLNTFEREGVRLRMLAIPFAELEIREAVRADLRLFGVGAVLLAIVVLRLALVRWRLATALLVAHTLYLSILPGLFQVAGYRPDPFAVAVFPLLAAIQLALLAHIGTAFMRRLATSSNDSNALEGAVSQTGKSCLFATFTTVAGLLALNVSGTEGMRELGRWGAAGVLTGFLFSFGPGLSILALIGGYGKTSAASGLAFQKLDERWRGWAKGIARFSRKQRRKIILSTGIFVAVTAPGILFLRPDVRIESFLPRGSDLAEAVSIADAEYGGLHFAQLDFDSGRQGGISSREFLEFTMDVHRRAEAIPEVTAVYSYPQVLTVLNQVWHGGRRESLRLPEENWLLRMFTAGLDAFDLPLLGALADNERRQAFMVLRMPSVSSQRYLEIVETVAASAAERAPQGVSVEAGGIAHEFLTADREVVRAQTMSAIVVLTAVGLLLLALWRAPGLTLKALVVTVLPVAAVLGVAGYAGMPLNAITVMAGALAIGIAVDDAVHFITYWQDAGRRAGDPGAALEETLLVKGPPIFFTSAILIGVFLLLCFSSFLPVAQLGLLVAGSLALTLPIVFLLLPVMLGLQNQ